VPHVATTSKEIARVQREQPAGAARGHRCP
jgi:hypothetical protein